MDIQRLVLGQGLSLVLSGLVLGIALSLATSRLIATLLFQVKPADFATYATVCALLGAVGLLAGYLPARTASKIDPSNALRDA
jgi:ABC-type antimicrobial peptide transport system permease subunit